MHRPLIKHVCGQLALSTDSVSLHTSLHHHLIVPIPAMTQEQCMKTPVQFLIIFQLYLEKMDFLIPIKYFSIKACRLTIPSSFPMEVKILPSIYVVQYGN